METSGQNEAAPQSADAWHRSVVEKLALEGVREQKARRRWSIFFRFLGFFYVTIVILIMADWSITGKTKSSQHTAVVELRGVIDSEGAASAERINASLQAAFADSHTAAVILRINSPGGSPVQAGMINDEIKRLRKENPNIPLYAVVEEICASGGYYVAAAADKIFVDKASLVGSIGVLMDGFGFDAVLKKLGVERRLLTAGENKGFLDPFSPMQAHQKAFVESMLQEIHQQFIKVVREGRGKRLKENPSLFSGLVWSGTKSVELGLADGHGSVESVARDVVKVPDLLDFTTQDSLADRLVKRIGVSVGEGVWGAFMTGMRHEHAVR